MSRFKVTMMAAGLILPLLLVGCGGGGGDGGSGGSASPTYSGSTIQAIVTTSNARALSVDAYSASQLASAVSGVAKPSGENNGNVPLLQNLAMILEGSVATILGPSKTSAKVVAATAQNTVPGFSGSFSYSINYDQVTGVFNGTVSFSQYRETAVSATISGSMDFSGVYNQPAASFTSLNISLKNLNGSQGGKSFSLAGNLAYSSGIGTKSVTMSVLLIDNLTSRTYWAKDFVLTLVGSSLTMSGIYFDPIYGFVVISTVAPLTVASMDAVPTAGQLFFAGANNTKVRLTFVGGGSTVEADTAGNGNYVVVP